MNQLIRQLDRIFNGLLGCHLGFRFRDELTNEEWDLTEIENSISEAISLPSYILSKKERAFGFPVTIYGRLAGLVVATEWTDVTSIKAFELGELLTLVFESSLEQADRLQLLSRMHSQLELLETPKNVISLHRAKQDFYDQAITLLQTEGPKKVMHRPLLIQVISGGTVDRVAFDLHSLTGRWAFLRSSDVSEETFTSTEKLRELGAATLFINDLSGFDLKFQEKLAQSISGLIGSPSEDAPHVLASISSDPSELLKSGKISQSLFDLFTVSQIHWGKGESLDTMNETLEQILERCEIEIPKQGETSTTTAKFIPFNPKYWEDDKPTLH